MSVTDTRTAEACRVLLVDDSPLVRKLIRIGLETLGDFTVVAEGADGGEAIALAESFCPDVVLLDLAMPVMDGLEALPELRRRCPSAAVVILSGFDDTMEERCLAAGAGAYVTKDGDIRKIAAALGKACRNASTDPPPPPAVATADPMPVLRHGKLDAAGGPDFETAPDTDTGTGTGTRSAGEERGQPAPPARRWSQRTTVLVVSFLVFAFVASLLLGTSNPVEAGALAVFLAVPVAVLSAYFGPALGLAMATLASGVLLGDHLAGQRRLQVSDLLLLVALSFGAAIGIGVTRDRARRALALQQASMTAVVGTSQTLATAVEQLRAANRDLEAANTDLRQFGFVVSHDLAEPLRTMAGFARLLSTSATVSLDETAGQYLDHIQDGAVRMQRLIEDLRSYTTAGYQDLRAGTVDLASIVSDATRNLEAAIRDRGARVVTGELPVVLGDRSLLGLVIQNVISNGLKFNRSEVPTIDIGASRAGSDTWRIDMTDNGIGMSAKDSARAFALFVRLQPRDAFPGTGLGLAICKRIVERHGGTISIAPAPTGGSTVSFTLPAVPESPAAHLWGGAVTGLAPGAPSGSRRPADQPPGWFGTGPKRA